MKRICHAAVLIEFIFLYILNASSSCSLWCTLTTVYTIYIAFTSYAFLVVSVTGALWKLNININEPCGGGIN